MVYLGQEVPYSNIKNCIKQINPSHIYTFFTIRLPQLTLSNLLIKLQSDFRKVKICVSGNTEIIGTVSLMPTIKWIQSSAELLEYTRSHGS